MMYSESLNLKNTNLHRMQAINGSSLENLIAGILKLSANYFSIKIPVLSNSNQNFSRIINLSRKENI